MAYLDVKKWSTTAGSNVLANTGITWDEGMAPSSVNDSARATMAALAAWYQASYDVFQARLTLTTAVPVTTADVTAAGTIFLTPYKGNQIWLYDGAAQWNLFNLSEISLALSATSGKPYDVFVFDNAGTPTLETLVWTNDTTRATALTTQNGILVKTGATTRRYVGTFYASGSNTTEDSFAKRYVWNYYNRVKRPMRVTEATDSWFYTTATIRQMNGSTANQLDYVVGVSEDTVEAQVVSSASNSSVGVEMSIGVGLDSTTTFASGFLHGVTTSQVADQPLALSASWTGFPGVGRHFSTALEYSGAGGTTNWRGDGGVPTRIQSGISGSIFG